MSSTKKPPAPKPKKTASPKPAPAKKSAAPKAAAAPPKKTAAKKTAAPRKVAARADFGAPVDGFFAKQPAPLRALLEAVRALVLEAAPDAVASLKWGQPFYAVAGGMMCALTAHKAHVNLVLSGPPGAFPDPDGLLEGEGKTGRRLVLRSLDDLPKAAARKWLAAAAKLARSGQTMRG